MQPCVLKFKSKRSFVLILLVVLAAAGGLGYLFGTVTSRGKSSELTFDWYEGRSLNGVADSFQKRGFTVTRKQVEGEYGERIEQVIARHENYRPGLLVRTGLVVIASSRDASDLVGKVEFFYFYVGP